jgi:hypothetical protein
VRTPRLTIALAIASSAWLSAPAARAFCREITQTTPLGYDPAVSGCYAGDGTTAFPVYWANACVSYSLQQDASSQIGLAEAKTVAALAFSKWSAASCGTGSPSITASEIEPPGEDGVACSEIQYNKYGPNQNVIIFRDDGWPDSGDSVNTLGLTTVTYDTTDGEIYDADIEINSHDYTLSALPPAPSGGYDLLSILTHEAGHFFGLAHSADPSAIMYAFYHANDMSLTADDVSGICSIYPPDGTRATANGPLTSDACCAVPRHGFDSVCAPEGADGSVIPPATDMTETALVPACGSSDSSSGESPSTGGAGDGSGHSGGCATSGSAPHGGARDEALMSGAMLALLAIARLRVGSRRRRAAWRKRHIKDACGAVLNESI